MKASIDSVGDSLRGRTGGPVTEKAVRLLASTIYKQLQEEGCAPKDIISVSTQLLDLVTCEIQRDDANG